MLLANKIAAMSIVTNTVIEKRLMHFQIPPIIPNYSTLSSRIAISRMQMIHVFVLFIALKRC